MSRSGYIEDGDDNWSLIRWRGAVKSAIKGQRGQQLLRELAGALDAMPVKELIADDLVRDGEYCALGVVGAFRGIDMSNIDAYDCDEVAEIFGIAPALAAEIEFRNDEAGFFDESGSRRWSRMRRWVSFNLEIRHLAEAQQ